MYKVFFYQHKITISNDKENVNDFDQQHIYSTIDQLKTFLFEDIIEQSPSSIYIYTNDVKTTWKAFKSLFKVKRAAGGIVYNELEEWLFIKRRGKWDLPKGHIEKDEHKKAAAIREVSEECGIQHLTIEKKVIKTYHTYRLNKKPILKPAHWYLMHYKGKEKGYPQTEEDITEVKWAKLEEVPKLLENTFETIKDVWEATIKTNKN